MAKIKHNNFIDTINDTVEKARNKDVIHLQFTGNQWTGSNMKIGDNDLINFGTCGYLGLETNPKLIEGAIDYTSRFGTQFSVSRAFVASKQNMILEERLSEIFGGYPTIVFSSTTLAHVSVIPTLIGLEDAIIMDQQAHLSMQTASQLIAAKGGKVELIRHNDLLMLEDKLKNLRDKYSKIWYVIDGVYSMYGDIAPFKELNELAKIYPQLHFYVDDAHGISWQGINGRGSAFDFFIENQRTILVSTMAKGFGSTGGIVVFPNDKLYDKVLLFGGPLSFSHPIAPAILGASMASCDIHLSNEIVGLQKSLEKKINLCNALLNQTDLPVLSFPETPIYFIGTGKPNVGFNFNKRILNEGFYVNLGIFPAVSIKNTGLRFTLTNHVTESNVKDFVAAMEYHYPRALEEEGSSANQVRKAFKLDLLDIPSDVSESLKADLSLSVFHDINDIDKDLWDSKMSSMPGCTWENLKMTQEAYSGNEKLEENAEMYYYIVKDENDEITCCTVFSLILLKDDMFESSSKSIEVERFRINNPYYLVSKTFLMGSLLSEGSHIYLNYELNWRDAFDLILQNLYDVQQTIEINNIVLRDFEQKDHVLEEFLYDRGFAKTTLPNQNIVNVPNPISDETIMNNLSKSSRQNFKRYIIRKKEKYSVEICTELTTEQLDLFQQCNENIRQRNFAINIFKYPKKVFEKINKMDSWEFIILRNKLSNEIVAIGCAFKSKLVYNPVLIGLNDQNSDEKVYHQMLYQALVRAGELNCTKLHLGLSADEAKKDIGAYQIKKIGFVQIKDNYNFEVLENLSIRNVGKN